MIRQVATLTLLLLGASFADDAEAGDNVVELPRPNSGTFSFEQAEARKLEVLSNKPTNPLAEWANPYMGFSIHIHRDDSITVYGHWLRALDSYNQTHKKRTIDQIKVLADELPLAGNPACVLVTSDAPLKDSKIIHKVLDALLVPSVQLFYVSNSEQGVAPQSATRSESNSEGGDKPQPESEERSR